MSKRTGKRAVLLACMWVASIFAFLLGVAILLSPGKTVYAYLSVISFLFAGIFALPPAIRRMRANQEKTGQRPIGRVGILCSYFFLVTMACVLLVADVEQRDEPGRQTSSKQQKAESNLQGATLNVYELSADQVSAVRLVAYEQGKDGEYYYPEDGPMALIVMPLRRFTVKELAQVFPLICEVTALKEPGYWRRFADVRIVDFEPHGGFAYRNNWVPFVDACNNNDTYSQSGVISPWGASLPLEIGIHTWNIGYGDSAFVGKMAIK